jgi:hypothetical protein
MSHTSWEVHHSWTQHKPVLLDPNNTTILANKSRYMDRTIREAIQIEFHLNNINREDGFSLSKSRMPLIRNWREHTPSPNKNMMPSGEPWKRPFSSLLPLHTQPPPCNLPQDSLLVHIPFPIFSPTGSLPSTLALQDISPLIPCLVISAPELGDSMFLQNVSINLQIHMAPKPKTWQQHEVEHISVTIQFCIIWLLSVTGHSLWQRCLLKRAINDTERKLGGKLFLLLQRKEHLIISTGFSPPVTIPVVTKWLQDNNYEGHDWLHQAELQSHLFTEPQKSNCICLPNQAACTIHTVWSANI